MSIREQLIEAVKEVSQDNAASTLLVEKVLSGDVNLTPAEAQEVQAVLEAAKALLASQPEAMGAIESIETALRPVIAANVLQTVATNTPGTSTTNAAAGVQSVTFSPESSSENSVANTVFSTSRQVTSNLGSGLEAHNANILTPFVQQVVGADGNLGGSVRVSGQVGNLADQSAQQNAGNVGSGSVARLLDGVKIVDTEKPVEVAPPPTLPPVGKVFIKADQESVLEQSEGLFRTISFTVTRSDATGKAAVAWKAEGIDLQDLASGGKLDGKVEFAPGQRTAKIEFVVRGDNLQEGHETITVQLGTTEGFLDLGGGPSKASTVISNDDGIFSVSAAKDSQLEGGKDESPELVYKVTRTDATSVSSVKWKLEGLNPKDFANEQLPSGELQFAAGQLEALVTIKLKGDDIVEPSLTAKIVLFDPGVNATISSNAFSSETLIRNDDSVTSVRAVRAEQLEGQPGHTPVLEYIVERTDTTVSTTIDWKLEGLNPADFGGALPTGQVFLAAGQSSATVRIFTKPDYEIEPDETAVITLVGHGKNTTIDPLKNSAQTIIRTDDQGFVVKAVDAEKIEGKLGTTTTATFKIIRDGDLENPASVGWQVAGLGDGISGQNFSGGVMPSGTVQFAAFETEKMIEVVLAGNDIAAPDKSYQVLLKDPSSGNRIIIGSAEGKILDDDATVQVKAIASEIPEGNTGVSIAKFEILRTNKLGAEQTVKWSLRAAGELPIKADDFSEGTAMSGEVVFAPNQSVFILEVPIKSDSVSEGNKLFTLDLQDEDGNNLSLGQSRAQITILSDDSAILVRAQATDLLEGSSSDTARTHEFVIERSRNFGETFTVNWQVKGVGDTPVDAADFGGTLPSGTVTFGPQDTQKIVSFTPTPDQMLETDEHFLVEISTTASGVEVIGATARGTVMDDEASFQFTQAEWSVSEGDSGEITLQAVVQRTGFVLQNGTVKWRLNPVGDNPVSLDDLLADQDKAGDNGGYPSGTLSFEVGQSSALIEVKIRPDSVQELNETFRLQLSDPGVGHILGSVTQATGIIVNDDSTFSIAGPQTVIEGPAGAGNTATFVVTRSGSLEGADSVKWRVVFPDGGATAADFTGPVSGVLQFATVSATQNIVLQLVGDDVFESNENFSVELYEPSLGTLVSGTQGTASSSIVNDDSRVTLQGVTISALEGNAQNGIFTYKAVREGNLNSEISVNWEITGSGNNPAVASDFVAITGTVVIAAGASEGTFTVSTVSDNKLETTEGFTVLLKAPNAGSGFLLGDAVSVVSEILNDDQKVSIADATPMQELAEGSTVNHVFTITREGPIESAATLNWRVDGVTATAADFPGGVLPTGQVEFLANQATATVTVAVAGDGLGEGNETFKLVLTSANSGFEFVETGGTGTILDDDVAVSVNRAVETTTEGAANSTKNLQFVVSRQGELGSAITLNWTATGDTGPLAANTGTVTLAANQATATINLVYSGNNTINDTKTIGLTLDGNNITVVPEQGKAVGTVSVVKASDSMSLTDDDSHFSFATNSTASIMEGNASDGGFKTVTVSVERSGKMDGAVSLQWKVVPKGTFAVNADDFVLPAGMNGIDGFPAGTISFADGAPQTIEIQIKNESLVEADEQFDIVLSSSAENVSVGANHTVSILADDPGYVIYAQNPTQNEGRTGTVNYVFEVERVGVTASATTVNYTVSGAGGNPANAADFGGAFPTGTVNFLAGETKKLITVAVSSDSVAEQNEGFKVTLSGTGVVGSLVAESVITNDDIGLDLQAFAAVKAEGNTGTTDFIFEITRSGLLDRATTTDWQVNTGVVDSADFLAGQNLRNIVSGLPSGTVSFAAGETSKQIVIKVVGDGLKETNEVFTVQLLNPGADTDYFAATANGTIENDDAEYEFAQLTRSVTEGDSGTANITFTVTRTGKTDQATTVNWTRTHGTTNSSDFEGDASGTLEFASGQTSKTITLKVVGDNGPGSVEGDETFKVVLSNASLGSSIKTGHTEATGTIVDNDVRLKIDTNSISLFENRVAAGVNTNYVYTFTREGYLGGTDNFTWTSQGDSSGSRNAVDGTDISGGLKGSAQTVSFSPNETTKTVTIVANRDDTVEPNEWFRLNFSSLTEFDEISGFSTLSSGGTVTYHAYGEIKRDEPEFDIAGFYASKPADGLAGTNNIKLTSLTSPLEGNGQTSSVWFRIERSISQHAEASVTWKLVGQGGESNAMSSSNIPFSKPFATAADGTDFVTADAAGGNGGRPSGTVVFADQEQYKWVEIVINGDVTAEDLEQYYVSLTASSAGSSIKLDSVNEATRLIGHIRNDDAIYGLNHLTINEGSDGGPQEIKIRVDRGNSTGAATIDWNLSFPGGGDDLATKTTWYKAEASDFADGQLFNGTLSFADGDSEQFIVLQLKNDQVAETWFEYFSVTLSNLVAGLGSPAAGISTVRNTLSYAIIDDDHTDTTNAPILSLTANKTEEFEGTASGGTVTYTITRSGNTAVPVEVAFRMSGLPSADVSFSGDSTNRSFVTEQSVVGVVNFTAGQTSKTITTTWTPDNFVESDKTITFELLTPTSNQQGSKNFNTLITGYSGSTGWADIGAARLDPNANKVTVTQKNDDVRLWVNGYFGSDPSIGGYEDGPLTFTITRSGYLGVDKTITYSMTNRNDFKNLTGSITLPANQASVTVNLDVFVNDTSIEAEETFVLTLTSADASVRFAPDGQESTARTAFKAFDGKIQDDDNTYTLTIAEASKEELDNSNQTYTFTANRNSSGYRGAVTLRYQVEGTGTDAATAADFVGGAFPTGTVTIAADQDTANFTVQVAGDLLAEKSETFKVTLTEVVTGKGSISTSDASKSKTATIVTDDTGISIADVTSSEADGNQTVNITVTRSGDLRPTNTMSWAVNHLTTTAADFTGNLSGNLSFAANETTKTITLTLAPDTLIEGTESFEVNLANFVGVDEFIKTKAVVTVNDNDSVFNIAATEQALSEASANFSFEITRTYATPQNQTINWAVAAHGDRTVNAADFAGTLPSGSVTFTGNELSKTITFSASNDAIAEPSETFKVVLTGGAGFTGSSFTNSEGFGKIVNDDQALELVMATTEFREGSQDDGQVSFQVLRSGSTAGTASVAWALDLTGKTATADDFSGLVSGTVQFLDGETSKTVTISIAKDSTVEADETFLIKLSNATGAPITVSSLEGKITNDDANLSINSGVSGVEGLTGISYIDFTVTRTGSVLYGGSVLWRVLASGTGSLADASDFEGGVLPTGTLEFAANATTGTIRVPILGDSQFENNENFTVELYNPSAGMSLLQATGTGTINNDDAEFILESATNSVVEGTASGNPFVFTIKRTGVFSEATTVEWFLADSSVANADDFVGTLGGTVNFTANQAEVTVTLQTKADRDVEADEAFTIGLRNVQAGHSISSTQGSKTWSINNDDADIVVAAVSGSVHEGDTTGNDLVFRVTRTGDSSQAVEFDWTVVHQTTDNQDFLNATLPSGKVSFLANQTTFDITIKTNPDFVVEADETFTVQLSNVPAHLDLVTATASGSILSDDDEISFTTLNLEQEEGTAAGNFAIFKFTVGRSNGVGAATADWTITGTGDRPATADDFSALTGQVSFLDGETSKDIEIAVVSDSVAEYQETFQVTLSNPSLGSALKTGASVATGKILNDDPAVFIAALDAQKSEGAAPGMGMRFEIIRTGNLQAATTVNWAVEGSGTNPANIADFGGFMPSGQVAFAAGEGSKIVVVGIRGDDTAEPDETFTVRLSNVTGATVLQESVEATILNDDAGIVVKALDPVLFEGSNGNTPFRFQIEALGPINQDVTATWRIKGFGGNAAGTDDFAGEIFPSGQITLNAQNRSTIVTIDVLGDSTVGPDEEFEMILENVTGAQVMEFSAVSKIQDDDSRVGFTTRELSKAEGNSGESTTFVYDVSRTGYLETSGTVEWRVVPFGVDGVNADDFSGSALPAGTINWSASQSSAQIQFQVAGDNTAESVERFRVELFNPSAGFGLSPEAPYADGTIQNDDQELSIFAVDAVHKEGSEFSDPFTFDVYRSGKTDGSLEVTWRILPKDGVASADAADFAGPMSGSFTWAANQISHRLSFAVNPDTVAEADERFVVEVSAANMASVQSEGTILNDDASARLRSIQYEAEVVMHPELATGADLEAAGLDHGILFSMSQIASDFSDSNAHVFTDDEIS